MHHEWPNPSLSMKFVKKTWKRKGKPGYLGKLLFVFLISNDEFIHIPKPSNIGLVKLHEKYSDPPGVTSTYGRLCGMSILHRKP